MPFKIICALAVLILSVWIPGIVYALHVDVIVDREGDQLTAGFCAGNTSGCDSLDALATIGVPSGTLPRHGISGQQIFVTDFGDFAGGPYAVDDPGFFAGSGVFSVDTVLRYQALGSLQYWNPTDGTWSSNTPGDERVRLAGGLDVQRIEDSSSCGGLLICIPDVSFEFTESSTLFTAQGISGATSLIIDNTLSDGSLHTHLDWFIELPDATRGGAAGAYLVELALSMDGFTDSDPFHVLFNRGLGDAEFAAALLALIQASAAADPSDVAIIELPIDLPTFDHAAGNLDVTGGTVFELDAEPGAPAAPYTLNIGALTGGGSIDLGSNRLRVRPTADIVFGGIVTGAGDVALAADVADVRLEVTGLLGNTGWTMIESGTLAMSGAGTFSTENRLLIAEGAALDIAGVDGARTIGALNGGGEVLLGANDLAIGSAGVLAAFTGDISGTGGITKVGNGEQRLFGTASFNGDVRIDAGKLTVVPTAISQSVINLGELHFVNDEDAVYDGVISGSGRVSKSGAGRLSLTGANSHTGGTFVDEGILSGSTMTLSGNIETSAVLEFVQPMSDTFDGTITGSGSVTKLGAGVLTLSGSNSYSGGTRVSGPLAIRKDTNLGAVSGDLILDNGELHALASLQMERDVVLTGSNVIDTNMHAVTLDGPLRGSGSLTKYGTGTLQLSSGSFATGLMNILSGGLSFRHNIGGDLTVSSGAGVTGSGTIAGNLRLKPGATLGVAVTPLYADAIVVRGRAEIAGAIIQINAVPGSYAVHSAYPIITAERGLVGEFSSVTSNLAFLTPRLLYNSQQVSLHLARNDQTFSDFATNPNQAATAQALNGLLDDPSGDATAVIQGLQVLPVLEVPTALNTLAGVSGVHITAAAQAQTRAVARQVNTRLRRLDDLTSLAFNPSDPDEVLLASAPGSEQRDPALFGSAMRAASALGGESAHGAWMRAFAGFGDFDLAGSTTADADNAGVIFGYDRRFRHGLTAGVYGLYSDAEVNEDGPDASTSITGWQAGTYARWMAGHWHIDVMGGYGWEQFESNRTLTVGLLNRTASAAFDGTSANVYTEIGYARRGWITVEPFIGFGWSGQWRDAYREQGAGAIGLSIDEQYDASVRSLIGVRAQHAFRLFEKRNAVVETRISWAHEFGDPAAVSASFLGDGTNSRFRVTADSRATDSALVGASIAAELGRRAEVFADFNGEIDGSQRYWSLGAGVRVTW